MQGTFDQVLLSVAWLDVLVAPAILSLALLVVMCLLFSAFENPKGEVNGFFRFFARVFWFYLGCAVPVMLLGVLVGYITGYSRTPIAGSLLTAILTLSGGLVVYAFGKDNQYRVAVGVCVTIFSLNILLGLQYGSFVREDGRQQRLERLAIQESAIRNVRRNLDLPDEPPLWMLGGEPQAGSR